MWHLGHRRRAGPTRVMRGYADPGPDGILGCVLPQSASEWLATGVVVVAVVVVALFFLFPRNQQMQCDGSVPTWMITPENEDTGCVEILAGPPPSSWDGSWICIGLCAGPHPSPFYPSDEPSL